NPILNRQQMAIDMLLHDHMKHDSDLAYIFITDKSREVLSHTFTGDFPPVLKELSGLSGQEGYRTSRIQVGEQNILDISAPVLEEHLGRLHVGMSLKSVNQKIGSVLFTVSCVIAALFLVAAIALGLYLERIVIRPVRNLGEQVRRLGDGHFDCQIDIYSRDEIGALGSAFNEMRAQLKDLYSKMWERSDELVRLNEQLEQLATTDGLTGLYNHRHFYIRLTEEVKRSKRYQHPLTLIMGDIDHFKQYNDKMGHVAGDKLLKIIAGLIAENARENDLVARYGGEEIAVILPETGLDTAQLVAERMRAIIESSPELVAIATQPGQAITMSFGVARLDEATDSPKGFVRLADAMLYRAKQNGRNRVES
ncbi:MAG: diguanylate cyclase, partial [Deltaproteobacteria bacterium]|nr:diguanylate cyclase [Deltaproteobacteria bacterium]